MTAARKFERRPFWETQPKPRHYSIGDISRREREPAMQIDCKRCGALVPQQLTARYSAGGETWRSLGCAACAHEVRP